MCGWRSFWKHSDEEFSIILMHLFVFSVFALVYESGWLDKSLTLGRKSYKRKALSVVQPQAASLGMSASDVRSAFVLLVLTQISKAEDFVNILSVITEVNRTWLATYLYLSEFISSPFQLALGVVKSFTRTLWLLRNLFHALNPLWSNSKFNSV